LREARCQKNTLSAMSLSAALGKPRSCRAASPTRLYRTYR
jgi:hypothetical protein